MDECQRRRIRLRGQRRGLWWKSGPNIDWASVPVVAVLHCTSTYLSNSFVILSEVSAARSAALMQSKDPY
jgi:hypothetical protein